MFDIGFWEICLIGIIALIVIGPEKLPRVARVAGMWIGKFRGMVRTVKHDIDEQLRLEELRQSMQNQQNNAENTVKNIQQEFKQMDPTSKPDQSNQQK